MKGRNDSIEIYLQHPSVDQKWQKKRRDFYECGKKHKGGGKPMKSAISVENIKIIASYSEIKKLKIRLVLIICSLNIIV